MNISREDVLKELNNPESSKYIPRDLQERWEKPLQKVNKEYDALSERNFNTLKNIVMKLHREKANLIAGTDAGNLFFLVPGFALHSELQLLNEIGIPAYDVLKMATTNAAVALGKENEFGTLEVGKRADLLLLDKNPIDGIAHLKEKQGVMIRGVWLSRADIEEMAASIEKAFVR